MSVTSAEFLHDSIFIFGPRLYSGRLRDRLVPEAGAYRVFYKPFCIPHGGKGLVLSLVASRLQEELCRALEEPEVQDLLHRLEKEFAGAEPPPSTDCSDLDAVPGSCWKLKLAVVAGAVTKRFKPMRYRTNHTATPS